MANANVENGNAETIYSLIQTLVDDDERRSHHIQLLPSIYKVPSTLRDISSTSFNPRVVAIGPLHKQDEKLEASEGHKVTYMRHLFQRLRTPTDQTMRECVKRVHGEIGQIRACYAGGMTYNDVELAKMMVLDGCFLLEFILRWIRWEAPADDPIFCNSLLLLGVTNDLVLIENQIPFFVLQHIFKCTLEIIERDSLTKLILSFLEDINPFDAPLNAKNDGTNINYDHILGLLQECFWPDAKTGKSERFTVTRFHSAVDLSRAGVNFKHNKVGRPWLLAMEFKPSWFSRFFWSWGKPTLRMPVLTIVDSTELLLRNLIAYEQCSPQIEHTPITSYMTAIDMLVDTEQDVLHLVESEVLINHLGSNQEATTMINSLGQETLIMRFYYNKQWQNLYKFYNSYWPRNIAWVRRTYFNSPWNFIALLAAIILFTLTVVQTYFTIRTA